MDPSPELGDLQSPPPLPSVTHSRGGKEPVPHNAKVIRLHPPLFAGDFDNKQLRGAYYWQGLDRKKPKEARLRDALYYGEQRDPRCTLCEKDDRACMSMLDSKSTTGCAFCSRRNLSCSQANRAAKNTHSVPKKTDRLYRPSWYAHKHALEDNNREGTEPPAKRTRASIGTKLQQSSAHDDQDEFHTPTESNDGSVYTLPSVHDSGDVVYEGDNIDFGASVASERTDDHHQPTGQVQADISSAKSRLRPGKSTSKRKKKRSSAVRPIRGANLDFGEGPHKNSEQIPVQQSANYGNNIFEDMSRVSSTVATANASVDASQTERVQQLEATLQDLQIRLASLESMPVSQKHPQEPTTKALESRILKLEKRESGLPDGDIGDKMRIMETVMEKERNMRRSNERIMEEKIRKQTDDIAVQQSEQAGLREMVNNLARKVANFANFAR
ncbi:hypothetical protein E4T47_00554 [Aureobasidium subglaciale]|nr:hypothetical protein E4T43_01194 [Aureobasidium subglaciale]KAI5276523.1 hypothetical protein E4T47_00554 [Aureobasidium subglaciale]